MITPSIYVHIDGVRDQLSKLMSHLDEFPTPAEVQEHEGSRTGPARGFSHDLGITVDVASQATQLMIEELAAVEEVIHAAVADLTELDEDVAQSAQRLTSFVEDAVAQVAGESADGPGVGGPPAPAGGSGAPYGAY